MSGATVPPDKGTEPLGNQQKPSYSERVKSNVRYDQRLKRNVLEITLEKTNDDAFFEVSQDDVARICKTLGIDISAQVDGYIIKFLGKISVICVWMAAGLNLERFCKDVSLKVGDGIVTSMIRPAGKKDVTVNIVGLDFNTPDAFVIDYLNKFGTVVSNNVIYAKFETGPFAGKYNGERKYQVDFSKSRLQMGNYHIIDGNKVRIFYRGNGKTCARCHKLAKNCPGGALAKNCTIAGGEKIMLSDHMKWLWNQVGFIPVNFELDDEDKMDDDVQQAEKDIMLENNPNVLQTRPKTQEPTDRDIDKSDGITIRNIPRTLEDKDICDFLMVHGLPEDHDIVNLRINRGERNTWVLIEGLNPSDVRKIYSEIHFHETKQKFFQVPLYCKPLRNTSPIKPADSSPSARADGSPSLESSKVDPKVAVVVEVVEASPKPVIPGLPESVRIKSKKNKNNKNKPKKRKAKNVEEKDALITGKDAFLKTATKETTKVLEEFEFSDYDEEESDDEVSDDEAFEDSQEALSETEQSLVKSPVDFLTPLFQSSSLSTSTPGNSKRQAVSPANALETKKLKPQPKHLLKN